MLQVKKIHSVRTIPLIKAHLYDPGNLHSLQFALVLSIKPNQHSPSPSHNSPLSAAPSSRAGLSLKFLQSSLSSVFFGCIDVLPVVPVFGRNSLAADADRARPSSALTPAIGEDVV